MVTKKGTNTDIILTKNKDLKSISRLKRAICMLLNAYIGSDIEAIATTLPRPGLPTKAANGSLNINNITHRNIDSIRFVQKATLVH